jgi:hypothetical protein
MAICLIINFDNISLLINDGAAGYKRLKSPAPMGEISKDSGLPPKAYVPDPKLEAALENLRRAVGKAGGA